MKKILAVVVVALVMQACASKTPELKSPCVGAEGSPCDKRSVNAWWLHA